MSQKHTEHSRSIAFIFSRYYWLQIALIAIAVILGVFFSASIMQGMLLHAAMEQEREHFWARYEKNNNAPLPDTKNLYGYLWKNKKPEAISKLDLYETGVHSLFFNGKERIVVYDERHGKKLLLVFGESNVNRLIWLFGIAPLILSLFLLYSILWFFNRRARNQMSPLSQLAKAMKNVQLNQATLSKSPFDHINIGINSEVKHLKSALTKYHYTLVDFIERERLFTREVSHELRTPLSVIKGSLHMLESLHKDDPRIQRMKNTTNEMQLIIDTLLILAREGIQQLELTMVDIVSVVEHVFNDLKYSAEQSNMHMSHSLENLTLKANYSVAYMIICNLVKNALNYSQGTKVHISYSNHHLYIQDDGIGTQQSSAASQEIKGYGIGLKLVNKLSDRLGWVTEVDQNTQDNQGHKIKINVQKH